jgi:L-lactate dehydrogenase
LEGEFGLRDVCLGVPCVVGQGGVKQIIDAPLLPDEKTALSRSASILKDVLKQLAG